MHGENGPEDITRIDAKKDLSIWLSPNLYFSLQPEKSAQKAFAVLRMIRGTFSRITRTDFQILYGAYVRPLLEHANPVVYSGRTTVAFHSGLAHPAASKMVTGLKSMDYEMRLAVLDLFPLEYRRLRGELILAYALFEQGLANRFFTVDPANTRRPVAKRQPSDILPHLRRDGTDLNDSFGPDADAKRARLIVASNAETDGAITPGHGKSVPMDEETIAREKRLLAAKLETSFSNRTSTFIPPEQVKTSSLPESIPLDKIQTWRAKFRAIQQQRIKTDDIDQVLESTAASQKADQLTAATGAAALARGPRPGLAGEQQTIIRIDDTTHIQPFTDGSIPRTALAADEVAVRPIIARERRWRTRVTVLQSQGKTFYENIVLGILRNVILKEDSSGADLRNLNKFGYPLAAGGAAHMLSSFPQPLAVGASYPKPAPGATNYTNTGSAMAISTGQPGMSVSNSAIPHPHSHHHPQMHYSRYDQERFASGREETAGFRIDTMATYHGKALAAMVTGGGNAAVGPGGDTPNPSAPRTASYRTPRGGETPLPLDGGATRDPRALGSGVPMTPSATPDPYRNSLRSVTDARLAARSKARSSRIPIIIIPAAPTSLITMYNARDILQDLCFVTSQEKQAAGVRRENEILIHRQKSDGRSVPYRIIDQPNKLQPDEWNRVVAVFVQGQAWQFKGWPIGSDPAVIFSLVKGFHLKHTNMPLDANVAKWNVRVINLDQRRHLDKANFQQIWDQLDKHIAKCKPFLRA
ncbi:parafibromin [Clonorchis sinensis]|uniref:Parafibromin n=1 Tax=Clonorchis sinensis TaxID=79923 RepID=G7YM01_CLOSI|nr:parafibromin [Clonorchis sinensis]